MSVSPPSSRVGSVVSVSKLAGARCMVVPWGASATTFGWSTSRMSTSRISSVSGRSLSRGHSTRMKLPCRKLLPSKVKRSSVVRRARIQLRLASGRLPPFSIVSNSSGRQLKSTQRSSALRTLELCAYSCGAVLCAPAASARSAAPNVRIEARIAFSSSAQPLALAVRLGPAREVEPQAAARAPAHVEADLLGSGHQHPQARAHAAAHPAPAELRSVAPGDAGVGEERSLQPGAESPLEDVAARDGREGEVVLGRSQQLVLAVVLAREVVDVEAARRVGSAHVIGEVLRHVHADRARLQRQEPAQQQPLVSERRLIATHIQVRGPEVAVAPGPPDLELVAPATHRLAPAVAGVVAERDGRAHEVVLQLGRQRG